MEEISQSPSPAPLPIAPPEPENIFARLRARTMLWIPVGAGALLALIAGAFPATRQEANRFLAFGLSFSIAQAVWIGWQQRRHRLSLPAWLGPSPAGDDWKQLRLVPALMLISLGATFLVFVPLSHLFPKFVNQFVITDSPEMFVRGKTLNNIGVALLIVVIAPLVEEVLFRGFLLHRWAVKWGTQRAIIASSIAFGVLHADVLGHTVFGVVMCLLYIRSGTLRLPVAAHMLNNALAMAVALSQLSKESKEYTLAEFQKNWWVGPVCLMVGIALLAWLTRGNWDFRTWRLPEAPRLPAEPAPQTSMT